MSLRNMEVQYVGDTLYLPSLEREVKHIIVKDEDVKDWKHFEPVVRCRDCAYRGWSDAGGHFCARGIGLTVKPDGFCAWGNRVDFVTCKCGEELERLGRVQTCPSCGRRVMA